MGADQPGRGQRMNISWPHGATVKLLYVGWQRDPVDLIGWAKRDADGNLVSAYGLIPLDKNSWKVIEEVKTK